MRVLGRGPGSSTGVSTQSLPLKPHRPAETTDGVHQSREEGISKPITQGKDKQQTATHVCVISIHIEGHKREADDQEPSQIVNRHE